MNIFNIALALAGYLAARVQATPATPATNDALHVGTQNSPIGTHCGPSTYQGYLSNSLVDDCLKMLDNLSPDAGGGGEDGLGRGDEDWTIVGKFHRVIGNFSTCAFGCQVTYPEGAMAMLGIEDVRRVVLDSIKIFKHAEDGGDEKVGAEGDFKCDFAGSQDTTISWYLFNPNDGNSTMADNGPWSN
ncbi:hypothetical protein QBC41DRAFT_235227 [Cercophora samala]|uniref:Ecp2 effector protein-like domain-containing protein n=1 Tax=Cercophora samala TaxID=330535 RepID=A0AA40D5I4_9PEZI|nr:hypothetical protein QBC41DRAFT_235227 [Cercophora samala]